MRRPTWPRNIGVRRKISSLNMPAEPDEMQIKIDRLKGKASNESDKAKTEMHKNAAELEKLNRHWASSQPLTEQSKGSLCLRHNSVQTCLQWHFSIDVDWVPGSEVGLESLLDFCDRFSLPDGSQKLTRTS
jgi:hypothetical protein